jgi:hypothetical protein
MNISGHSDNRGKSAAASPLTPPSLFSRLFDLIDAVERAISEDHLIVFDRKTLCLITFLVLALLALTVSKIHYSSIAAWDEIVTEYHDSKRPAKVLWGTPKFIRIDEWHIVAPAVVSQAAKHFPVENYSLGGGKVPVLMGLPSRHFSALFLPQNWGYFLLGVEMGFSFFWNYGVILFVLSSFLLFRLLTRNKFWMPLFGSLFLFFSSFVQWWSICGAMFTAFNFMTIAFIYLVSSKRRLTIILAAGALFFFSINFSLTLYPPFQVPLALLWFACCAGYLLQYCKRSMVQKNLKWRVIAGVACLLCIASFAVLFYVDLQSSISLTMHTVYPGKRFSTGGKFGWERLFSGFYGIFFDEKNFIWGNICETSSFLLVFPVIVVAVAVRAIRGKAVPLEIALSAYLLFLTFYVLWGLPPVISRLTLLSFVPSYRAIIGLGVGNIILVVVFLGSAQGEQKIAPAVSMVLFILFLSCLLAHGMYLNATTNHFFRPWQISAISIFFSIAAVLLLNRRKLIFSIMILAFIFLSTCSVLPVSRGLGFIVDKTLYRVVKEIVAKDPEARWLVYRSGLLGEFISAAGANVLSGTKYCPDFSVIGILDPPGRGGDIYNRFAHIVVVNRAEVDKVDFSLLYTDCYAIAISPFSDKLRKLGIKYLLMPDDSTYYNVEQGKGRGIVPVVDRPIDRFWVLEIREKPDPADTVQHTRAPTTDARIF